MNIIPGRNNTSARIRIALAATAILSCIILNATATADEIRIAAWNVETKFTPASVQAAAGNLKAAAAYLKPDILMLEEVSSIEVVDAIRDTMGLTGFHTACSQYNQDHSREFASLETAIISRYPITQVVEYDPALDNVPAEGDSAETGIYPQPKLGIAPTRTSRGFLWVRIDAIKLTACIVHLKSSRGDNGIADADNAEQREFVAATIAESVLDDLRLYPDHNCIVAGDFNVGHSDTKKNGTNLFEDCYADCDGKDLYDDTHAIFGAGIIGGLKMKNLMLPIMDTTFPSFPGTPIDNFYVAGPGTQSFSDCVPSKESFGSDHLPILTVMTIAHDQIDLNAPAWHNKTHLQRDPSAYTQTTSRSNTQSASSTQSTTSTADPAAMASAKPVELADLKNHIGETVTIQGPVTTTNDIGNITFINFGSRNSGMPTVVVFKENYGKWPTPPVTLYKGKKIAVTGQGSEYKGAAQIVITDPSQVKIIE